MKNLKHYGLLAVASLVMVAAGCRRPNPENKIVGARVVDLEYDQFKLQDRAILDLEGERLVLIKREGENFELDTSLPFYRKNDTVWFRYNTATKRSGEIYSYQVVDTAAKGKETMDALRQQQRELYGKNR